MMKKLEFYAYSFLPKMSRCRSFGKSNCVYFMIKGEKVFNKYNEIWEKVSNIIKTFMVKLYTIRNI